MLKLVFGASIFAVSMMLAAATPRAEPAPYVGQAERPIATLSAEDVAQLLAGEGWGLAKPAEFNGYPGPLHVLDNAEALALTADQRARIEAIYAAMKRRAKALGAEYVAAEAALSAAFRDRRIDEARLASLTLEASSALAMLRRAHLEAHLETRPLLSPQQIAAYDDLRGYRGEQPAAHGGAH